VSPRGPSPADPDEQRAGGRGLADLPRVQVGSNPQVLLLSLFVDYWLGRSEPLPSAVLVAMLGDLGTSPASARAALSRLALRRALVASKEGRRTFYALSPNATRTLERQHQRSLRFANGEVPWDGCWTTVAFSVPDQRRSDRSELRLRLRVLGYAPLFDGVWVSATADLAATEELFARYGETSVSILRSPVAFAMNGGDPRAAWDLEAVRAAHLAFLDRQAEVADRLGRGRIGPAEALAARTELVRDWRELASSDPDLPDELLPAPWPGSASRQLFAQLYDDLGPPAEERVRELLRAYGAAALAERLSTQRSGEPVGG
jgi:phenylacetic acid degradation operon negative regulatory protein